MSLGIIIDERLSRERALWITQVVKKLRTWTQVEFLKSDTPPSDWPRFLAANPNSKLLVPAHRTRDTLRLEDPQRFGFYTCEPLSPTQWQDLLAAAPDRLHLQSALWNWNPSEKRLASLLLEMRAWLGAEATPEAHRLIAGTVGALIDQQQTSADPAAARRLILTLTELQPHFTGSLSLEWVENAAIRTVRATVPTHGQRLPQFFTAIAKNPRLARETHFARALWCAEDELLEITLSQYPWALDAEREGIAAPHSYWWGTAKPGTIAAVVGTAPTGHEPKLTAASLQADPAIVRENERLRSLIQELKTGGVGQSAPNLAPPETHVLLEAFKQRYFESKLEVRKLEKILSGPVADIRVAAIKKRIEELKTQHQEWIQILTDTLAQEKKRRSS